MQWVISEAGMSKEIKKKRGKKRLAVADSRSRDHEEG